MQVVGGWAVRLGGTRCIVVVAKPWTEPVHVTPAALSKLMGLLPTPWTAASLPGADMLLPAACCLMFRHTDPPRAAACCW